MNSLSPPLSSSLSLYVITSLYDIYIIVMWYKVFPGRSAKSRQDPWGGSGRRHCGSPHLLIQIRRYELDIRHHAIYWVLSDLNVTLSIFPEFIRVGYYVNIDYTEPELRETPPSPPLWEKLQRNILATNPRYSFIALNLGRKHKIYICANPSQHNLSVPEWPSSRSTGMVVMEVLRTQRMFRPREIQTSFLTTRRWVG